MALKEELADIVGLENVIDDPKTLDAYSKDLSFVRPEKPRLVVKPGSADEVQAIVNWANQTGTPLVPVSSGPPRFHGDTVPSVPGAVIVDLSGMKKIMRIDRRNRVAMIEPGVTYAELQPELARQGMRLSMPLLPRANKSVVASLLEREPRLVPRYQWTALEPLQPLEVVWGDGKTTPKEIRDRLLLTSAKPVTFRCQRRIKETFDPNNLGDTHYRTLDEAEE